MKMLEVSYKSMNMLEERFLQYRKCQLWVPDWEHHPPTGQQDNLDVLLMGSFFERIFQPEFWPDGNFNFFCLSSKSRQCLIELFGFEENVTGLINRNSLYPSSAQKTPFEINPETTFVCAGRISPQKNIEFLIFTLFYLQLFYSSQVQLKLIGKFDNIYHRDILGCHFIDYQKKIMDLINQLPWPGTPPELTTDLSELEWLHHLPAKGISISTSNLISEDFSVTSAQLEEIGYPMLLPYWGGFIDVVAPNVKHYSEEFISNSHQKITDCAAKAKHFAQIITKQEFLPLQTSKIAQDIIPTEKINRKYLDNIYSINLKRWGPEIQLVRSQKLANFVLSKNGQHFFSSLRKLLAE